MNNLPYISLMPRIKECYKIISSRKPSKQEMMNFCENVFWIAKHSCNAPDYKVSFEPMGEKTLGFMDKTKKTLVINTDTMNKKNLKDIVVAIYQEIKLASLLDKQPKKHLNTAKRIELPLEYVNKDILYLPLTNHPLNVNPYAFFITAKYNKESQDYSNEQALQFFDKLGELSVGISQIPTKLYIKKQISKINSDIGMNNFMYLSAKSQLGIPGQIYYEITSENIFFTLNSFRRQLVEYEKEVDFNVEKHIKDYGNAIRAFMQMYCDEGTQDVILRMAERHNVIDFMYSVINSPFSKITEKEFSKLFNLAEKNNISLNEIKENLTSWNKYDIDKIYEDVKNNYKPEPDEEEETFTVL